MQGIPGTQKIILFLLGMGHHVGMDGDAEHVVLLEP